MKIIFIYFLGYFVSVYIGHICSYIVSAVMWGDFECQNMINPFKGEIKVKRRKGISIAPNPAWTGMVERLLYTTSILIAKPEFIVVWLGMKMAGRWKVLQKGEKNKAFNPFFAGSGISLFFGVMGAYLVKGLLK